ncbi:MAG: hypothetical protein ABIB47_06560 [Candidatus Woesearchaeota archaeon]
MDEKQIKKLWRKKILLVISIIVIWFLGVMLLRGIIAKIFE